MFKGFLFVVLFLLVQSSSVTPAYEDIYDEVFPPGGSKLSSKSSDGEWDQDDEVCELNEKCVPYYLCKDNKEISSDGSFVIDERNDGPKVVISCPPLEKCCRKKGTIIPTPVDVCESFMAPSKCGFRNKKGLGGIALSMQNKSLYANFAEFPWMVAVLLESAPGSKTSEAFKSGGSLINPKVVLTTAHNIEKEDSRKLIVRAGEWDTQTTKEMCKHEERKVQRVIRHEQFVRANLQNDVALLILESEFEMTAFINTVCLPPPNTNFDGQRCFSGGWGRTKFGKANLHQVFLKKVNLPIIDSDICQTQLRLTRLGEDFELHEGFICAGGEAGNDVCTGDGGSHLSCVIDDNPDYFYLAGMVVGGIGCGEKNVPGFYADVSKYRKWIDKKLTALGISTGSYSYE